MPTAEGLQFGYALDELPPSRLDENVGCRSP